MGSVVYRYHRHRQAAIYWCVFLTSCCCGGFEFGFILVSIRCEQRRVWHYGTNQLAGG